MGVAPTLLPSTAGAAAGGATAGGVGKPAGRTDDPIIQEFVNQVGPAVVDNQETIRAFREWMLDQPGFADSGYVRSEDDPENKATVIVWHGPRTALLEQILAEGARRGIGVSVQASRWTTAQVHAATEAVFAKAHSAEWAGFTVAAVGAPVGTSDALTVFGSYTSTPAGRAASQTPSSLPAAVNGIPLHISPGAVSHASTGRDDDFAPFDAGGYMISARTGHSCSSGFALWYNGAKHSTTALHCDAGSYHSRDASDTGNWYGGTAVLSNSYGGRLFSQPGAALALDGPWNSNNYSKTVIGYADVTTNDYVCTGGGNSGEHCNIKIVNPSVGWNDGYHLIYGPWGIQQTAGRIANMQGDSGGPVISLQSTSSGQVRAAGMIQAYFHTFGSGSACGGAHDSNNSCGSDVMFTSMRNIANSVGGSLVTN